MIKTALSGLVGIAIGIAVTSAAPLLTRGYGETAAAAVRSADVAPAIDPSALMRNAKDLPATQTDLF
jgi:hypothetical protein